MRLNSDNPVSLLVFAADQQILYFDIRSNRIAPVQLETVR